MRLVDEDHRAVFLGDADHLLERSGIAEHRIDPFENDEDARAFGNALQALFHCFDIVVLEGHDLGLAHRAAVPDAGVRIDVEHDVIALARDRADDAEIGLISGGKDHRVVHPVKFAQRLLALLMALIGAVENAAAGGAGPEIGERLLARFDHIGIEGHAHVIVSAEQDRLAPVADRAGGGEHLLHHQIERILAPL